MVQLPPNEKQTYQLNPKPETWLLGLTLAMTLTFNFQGQAWNLLYHWLLKNGLVAMKWKANHLTNPTMHQIHNALFLTKMCMCGQFSYKMMHCGIWGSCIMEYITRFDAEACWPLNGPLFSPLNQLYSLMGVGMTGPPLSTHWSSRVLQAISSVMMFDESIQM